MATDARTELMEKIVTRAWEDESFKKELLADPGKAFEKVTGVKIPDDITVVAVEDTPRKLHLVIPMRPADPNRTLTDAELDSVSGGTDLSWGCGPW
jgi:hypothetical protein